VSIKWFVVLLSSLSVSITLAGEGEFNLFLEGTIARSSWKPRNVFIYFPKGYSERGSKRYPVLYMHDGQNLFDPTRSTYGQTWQVTDALNDLIERKIIPPILVVAVDNTEDRVLEYTHAVDPTRQMGGGAADYVDYLYFDLKRYIDHVFPTKPGPEFTGVMGSSLGGLVSVFAASRYPEAFGLVGALSPSVWWANYSIIDVIKSSQIPLRIYIDSGTGQGERPDDARLLEKSYKDLGARRTLLVIQEGAEHNEHFWAQRLPKALEFLFKAK
jgi:predicted alpha/beta superfamily hydrolase